MFSLLVGPWCHSTVYRAWFVSFSLPGFSLQGVGGSKLGFSIGSLLDFLNSTQEDRKWIMARNLQVHMFPKEFNKCNEFVEILKVFPHLHDIYCFYASRGVKPLVMLCWSLWEFGMSWPCLNLKFSFCIMFKPMKTHIFPILFYIDLFMICIFTSSLKASIIIVCFISSLFMIRSSPFTSNLNPNLDPKPWPCFIFTLTCTKGVASTFKYEFPFFLAPCFLSIPPSLHLIPTWILNLDPILSLL